jgi:hypothetical protein
MYYQNDVTNDIGAMPTIRFSDDHILSQALKIMYPQRKQFTTYSRRNGRIRPSIKSKGLRRQKSHTYTGTT